MFEVGEREGLRVRLIEAARQDPQVDAAALLGSAARGTEDRWSDIDLALRVAPGLDPGAVADRWTVRLQRDEVVVDHLDIHASGGLYRVFLLASTLQVDLSFWPHDHVLAAGAPVRPVFGSLFEPLGEPTAQPEDRPAGDDALDQVRMAWLYALHVRSALARGRGWQAEWMLQGIRNRLAALYCLGRGLPTEEGRGVDDLPGPVRAQLAGSLVAGSVVADTDPEGLRRTFRVLVTLLLAEIETQGLPVPPGLGSVLDELVDGL